MSPRRILVPVDTSEASQAAVAYARALVGGSCAELIVAPFEESCQECPQLGVPQLPRDLSCRHCEVCSAAVNGVLALAAEVGAEVIVIGTHERAGLLNERLAALAEGLALEAAFPIVTVKPRRVAAD